MGEINPKKLSSREHLIWLMENYKDEIPDEMISSRSKDKGYKVRKQFFQGVIGDIESAKKKGKVTSEEGLKAIDGFSKRFSDEKFKNRLTTKEDIDTANRLVNTILENWQ